MKRYLKLQLTVSRIGKALGWAERKLPRFPYSRLVYGMSAGLILLTVTTPVLQHLWQQDRYDLATSQHLLGSVNANLANKITFSPAKNSFQFNKDAIVSDTADQPGQPSAGFISKLKSQVGGADKQQNMYSVDMPVQAERGITYYDNSTRLSFSLVPQFRALPGRLEQGRVVYPLAEGGTAVYSVKTNGLKEDIILEKASKSVMTWTYRLTLPSTLEAKIMDDGGLGIYSADPSLFGDIKFGTNDDQQKVINARQNSPKDHLVFALPAPVIKEANKTETTTHSYFTLRNNYLTLVARNLTQLHYPLTVDPSVVVTSASDFSSGNNEGGIDFDAGNNQIKRGGLTGGTIGSWTSTTSLTNGRDSAATVVYNGYMYVIGGTSSSSVEYAPINSNGTTGTWNSTTSLTSTRYGLGAVTYNGYLYVMGGNDGAATSTVQYAPINSNGTIGSWTSTTSFTTARYYHSVAVFNNYLYVLGGKDGSGTILNDVQYAPLKATGTVGSWTSTTSFTTARYAQQAVAYNGYLYVLGGGGSPDFTGFKNDVQYAPINTNGTVGTWNTTTSFTTARSHFGAIAYNGYLYIAGGLTSSVGARANDVQYAPINANGTVGNWATTTASGSGRMSLTLTAQNGYLYLIGGQDGDITYSDVRYAAINTAGVTGAYATTTSFTTARIQSASVAYNGYLYILGGVNSSSTALNDVQYAQINANGTLGSWASTTSFTTARFGHTAVAYNGYLYILGGNSSGTFLTDVQYAPINSNGTIGSWTTTTNFTTGRDDHASVVYNGYLYIMGGTSISGITTTIYSDVQYAPINANGTLGSWTATTSLSSARYLHAAAVYAGYVYTIGGIGNSGDMTTVQYAQINANGTIGSWTATTSLAAARNSPGAGVYNGYLYIMGGTVAGSEQSDVQYAQINANGTLGTWNTTTGFTTGRAALNVAIYNSYLYILGGSTNGGLTYLNSVQYATINNGGIGTAGSWTSSTSFTTGRHDHTSVAYNGYVYVIGGQQGTTYYNDVQYAPINADGTLGSWTATTSFTTARAYHTSVAYNGYVYIIGGFNNGTRYSDVQYARLNSDGTVGTWNTTTSLSAVRSQHASVVYNGYLYVLGGITALTLNSVQYAPINADGTLGSWTATTSFTTARSELGSVVYNGYVYVIGGKSALDVSLGDVQYAAINSNGTIGTWNTTTALGFGLGNQGVGVANGFIYLAGGVDASGSVHSDIQYAAVNTNGTLGTWMKSSSFTTVRQGAGSVIYNGYLYVLGASGLTLTDDTQYAPLNVIARKGTYSKLVDLGTTTTLSSIAYNGTLPGGLNAISYRMAGTDGVFGSSSLASSLSGDGSSCGSGGSTRYLLLTIAFDEALQASYSDTSTTVTDVTVTYTSGSRPTPQQRLRGGKFFANESLQPLDVCGP